MKTITTEKEVKIKKLQGLIREIDILRAATPQGIPGKPMDNQQADFSAFKWPDSSNLNKIVDDMTKEAK